MKHKMTNNIQTYNLHISKNLHLADAYHNQSSQQGILQNYDILARME